MQSLMRPIFLLVYACLIVLVPVKPNLYTILINGLGFIMATSATLILFSYLNSRPVQQKNSLNRVLTLLVFSFSSTSARHFVVSLAVYLWEETVRQFVDTHPRLTTILMSTRCNTIIFLSLLTIMSGGRLLLFVNPVIFQKIPPMTGAAISGLVAVSIAIMDFLGWVDSPLSAKIDALQPESRLQGMVDVNKTAEWGFNTATGLNKNNTEWGLQIALNSTNNTSEWELYTAQDLVDTDTRNITTQDKIKGISLFLVDNGSFCYPPTGEVILAIFIALEMAKIVFVAVREYNKNKKARTVVPISVQLKLMLKPLNSNISSRSLIKARNRSNSMPEKSIIQLHRRRLSLQHGGGKNGPTANKNLTFQHKINRSKGLIVKKEKTAIAKMKELLLRTSSILTIFVLIGLCVTVITRYISPASQFKSVAIISMRRLSAYVLIVVLVGFDKDIIAYMCALFNL